MENQTFQSQDYSSVSGGVLEKESALLTSVFGWMTFGLTLTGAVSYFVLNNPSILNAIGSKLLLLCFAQIAVVFWLYARIHKMSASTATACFLGYSISNGLTIAPLLSMYSGASVANAFLMTGALFGSMTAYGNITKKDLSSMGSFLMMGFFGAFIASLVNIFFLKSPMISWVVSVVFILACTGLTAWDVQKIKRQAAHLEQDTPQFRKAAIIGALSLYLNFIIIFQNLLSLMDD